MNKKNTVSTPGDVLLKLKVLAEEKEVTRLKLVATAKELALKAKELALTAKELAVTAGSKEDIRIKLAATAKELALKAKELATTAEGKENIRIKLVETAKKLALKAKELTTTATGKEDIRIKLVETAKKLALKAKELTTIAEEKENIRIKLAAKAKELEQFYASLEQKVHDRTRDLEVAGAKEEATLLSIGEGLLVTDEEGNITHINDAALKMLMMKREEIMGKAVAQVLVIENEKGEPIPIEKHPMSLALATGTTTTATTDLTYYYVRGDKTRFPVAIVITPIVIAGKTIGTIEVFRDITKEKEADKAKTEFVSLSSHQLRTPLTAINWTSELLLSPDFGSLNENQTKYVEEILNSSQRMVKLVAALLDISRIEFGTFTIEPKPINLKEITEIYLKDLKSEILKKKLIFTATYDPSLPIIQADPKLFGMILTNLLTNSVKYTPSGGQIKLAIGKGESDITIAISDTGLGIPKKRQSEVFKKLFRADNVRAVDPEGTGLGLYIVKGIVDQAGGKIWFESEEGKGSTFYVTFPLSGMKGKVGTKELS